ncbi:hypothetical protein Nepgr_010388 [Nepenthes gracilis]|uniref:Uncharacterized protein n=1 Tax=Nepenthes gracilis TaxID=150966 RepID=A0AAD3XKZ9_NEPGR|nr:hypothetical protein Nepgr_010388 [Nepenthes gracilis]
MDPFRPLGRNLGPLSNGNPRPSSRLRRKSCRFRPRIGGDEGTHLAEAKILELGGISVWQICYGGVRRNSAKEGILHGSGSRVVSTQSISS